MKNEDVKIGMKVVPHKKTRDFMGNKAKSDISNSSVWASAKRLGQPFLYVTKRDHDYWVLSYDKSRSFGDYFSAGDFTPFSPSEKDILQEQFDRVQKEFNNLKALLKEK